MKILLTGHVSYNLMAPFYRLLKEQMPQAHIAIYGLTRPGTELQTADYEQFDELIMPLVIDSKKIKRDLWLFKWLLLLNKHIIWYCAKAFFKFRFKDIYAKLYDALEKKDKKRYLSAKFAPFDVVNIHYLSPDFLQLLEYTHSKQKVALSFWGSDLFQQAGKGAYLIQLDAVHRADAISIHTPEMEQIFLSKFGRHLKSKIHQTIFGCDNRRFQKIRDLQQFPEKVEAFRAKYKIPKDKIVIQIGYSGGAGHCHLEVVESLEKYTKDLKDKICLLIPTTYNNQDTVYFEKLKSSLKNCPFELIHLTEYLSDDEVLSLPLVSNVHVNVRDADALNNSMMEALYSGNLLITGVWLPYGILKRRNISFVEIESIKDIGAILKSYVENPKQYDLSNNPKLVESEFSMQHHIPNWCKMYEHLCRS